MPEGEQKYKKSGGHQGKLFPPRKERGALGKGNDEGGKETLTEPF